MTSPVSGTDPGRSSEDSGEGALPRIVGTWRRAYILVIVVLAVDVVLLWLLGGIR